MKTKEFILARLGENGPATGTALAHRLGISRQAVSKHLQELVRAGKVVKEGETRGASYRMARRKDRGSDSGISISRAYRLAGLEEDRVFTDLSAQMTLKHRLSNAAFEICRYAFTEMLNNAIDHSKSEKCRVAMQLDSHDLHCRIRDHGIGIFHSISHRFGLPDEPAAVGELLKGKATTMAERHSGEGIFFTSKVVDVLAFRSHQTILTFDNTRRDVWLEQRRSQRGTEVTFRISRRSRRKMTEIFESFAPEEFEYRFEGTRVRVNVALEDCVSRSQAKRLVTRLESFRKVTLDFKKVRSLGQAFSDEVFRVFLAAHPETYLDVVNLDKTLRPVVRHVVDNATKEKLSIR